MKNKDEQRQETAKRLTQVGMSFSDKRKLAKVRKLEKKLKRLQKRGK